MKCSWHWVYTLRLSADDAVHAVAYDASIVTVTNTLTASVVPSGTASVAVHWTGGSPPYVVEATSAIPASSWAPVATNSGNEVTLPRTGEGRFFRVRGP